MSEASAHKLSYLIESTPGTTPANPRFTRLPDTRTTLNLSKENLPSERLTGNRFPAKPRTGASVVGGDIPADLSSRTYDDFIASALQGTWMNTGAGEDSFNLEIDDVANNGVTVNDTFNTTNGVVTVESIDSKAEEVVLTYDPTAPGDIQTFELFGVDSVTIDGAVFETIAFTDVEESAKIKAGETRMAFSILREFSDFAAGKKPFLLYKGCEVATWNLTAAANGLAKSTFTFFGRSMAGPDENAPTGTTYKPAIDTEPFDTFSGQMKVDGNATCIVTDYNLTINNGHAPRYGVGCAESGEPSTTQSVVEGSITAYFEDETLYKKFVDEETLALELTLEDSKGNKMTVNLPELAVLPGTQPDVTADGPITIVVNFSAHEDQTEASHVIVTRTIPVTV